MTERTYTWYDIPAGTRASQCRGETCHAVIYWIETISAATRAKPVKEQKMVRIPVDAEVDGGFEPSETDGGRGVSHFQTCPDVRKFSR